MDEALENKMPGTYKIFGAHGPVYQVLDIAGEDPEKGIMVNILVIESGERTALPLKDVEEDPNAA